MKLLLAVLAGAILGLVPLAFSGKSVVSTQHSSGSNRQVPDLTIYVQNFDPGFVRDSTLKSDIPVWEEAANGAFRKVWHTPKVKLVFVPRGKSVPRGAEVMQFTSNGPVNGAAAYHTQNNGRAAIVVYAGIDDAYGVSLSVAATHELFERLADATTANLNQGWPFPYFTVNHGQFTAPDLIPVPTGQLLINEVCDPVEEAHYVLKGKWISDWVTPNYFNDLVTMPAGVPEYDYLGLVQSPLEVLPGGYQSIYVIHYQMYTPDGVGFYYTGWLSLTNFTKTADKAWLAGDHGKVVPFSTLGSTH